MSMDRSLAREVACTVNGTARSATVSVRRTLADYLRQDLGLTGTHLGCEHGVCGACTVLVEGRAVRSCLMLAVQAEGCAVTTVEGIAPDAATLHPLQAAFAKHHALQCGFCTPGILTTLLEFLGEVPAPTAEEVRIAISGNLCRCTGYEPIVAATLEAAAVMRGAA
ncbi:(2Fe-2S)-binding protein [Falsiroseomonas ponticola]|uniref:(2Fe-2S)-binding protein n=1 Tax=Falsiroseomonas ponticola TaxID=2786951 RepID=UPI001CF7DDDB|nr:(2Fe-2S)-binding protein [Roseomonas ponticola]